MFLRLICAIGIVSGIVGELLPPDDSSKDLNTGRTDDDLLNAPWNSVKPPRPTTGPPGNGGPNVCDMNCIAEQLQAKIDAQSKRLNELEEELKKNPSPSEVMKLYAQVQEVHAKIEGVYKKLDDISSTLKQKLIQELEKMGKKIDELESEMERRVAQLEDNHDTTTSVLIRDALVKGEVESAVRLYGALTHPPLVLHYIIENGYQKDLKNCAKLLKFTDLIPDNKRDHNSQALELLLDEVTNNGHIYNGESQAPGSDCIFSLAAQAQQIYRDRDSTRGTGHLDATICKLPGPVSRLLFRDQFFMRKETTRCALTERQRMAYVVSDKLGDTAWTLSSGPIPNDKTPTYHYLFGFSPFNGLWYRFYQREEKSNTSFVLASGYASDGKSFSLSILGTNGVDCHWDTVEHGAAYVVDERLDDKYVPTVWKPILRNNDTISIQSAVNPTTDFYIYNFAYLDEKPVEKMANHFPCSQFTLATLPMRASSKNVPQLVPQFHVL